MRDGSGAGCALSSHGAGDWEKIGWDDIDTEEMEEIVKRFKSEMRMMPKEIRQDHTALVESPRWLCNACMLTDNVTLYLMLLCCW